MANSSLPDALDALSNHTTTDYIEVEEVECTGFDDEFIYITTRGEVHVTQEYGPKHDICQMNESYPFTLEMKSDIRSPKNLVVISNEIEVDTSSWYE